MQNLPKDIFRLVSHYLEWSDISELSFCCKILLFLSKDKKLLQYNVDKKYPIDNENLKRYHQQLYKQVVPVNVGFNIMNVDTIIINIDGWLTMLNYCNSMDGYNILLAIKYRYNLVRYSLSRMPIIHMVTNVKSKIYCDIMQYEEIEDSNKAQKALCLLMKKFDERFKEFDIIYLSNMIKYIIIKNCHNILIIHKFNAVLPIESLALLKIFNIKDRNDICWLYPSLQICGIRDIEGYIYNFYSDNYVGSIKKLKKLNYKNIEHTIYISEYI